MITEPQWLYECTTDNAARRIPASAFCEKIVCSSLWIFYGINQVIKHLMTLSNIDLFPRTDKSKILLWTCSRERIIPQKPLSTYSLERENDKIHTRHQPDAIVPRGVCGIDVKG